MTFHSPPSVSLALLLSLGLASQSHTWSDRFDAQGVSGRVFEVGQWRSDLVIGGYTFEVDGQTIHHVARFDGARWHQLGTGIAPDSDQIVRAVCEYGGDLIVAGTFSVAGGVSVGDIARFDGARWWSLGQGFRGVVNLSHGEIFDLAVYRGELYAAGFFDEAGGNQIVGVARWDGQTWRALGSGIGGAWDRKGLALCVHADELWVGGEFDSAGGIPAKNVAVWNGSAWRAVGAGLGTTLGSGVHALATFRGDVYGSGPFGASGATTTRRIARWDGNAWRPLGEGIPDYSVTAKANALAVFDDALYVGGDFAYVDASSTGSGIRAYSFARWDGTAWSAAGGVRGGYQTVIALAAWNGRLVVGGEFHAAGSPPLYPDAFAAEDLAAFDGQQWWPVGEGLGFDGGASRLLGWRGRIVAAGPFNGAGDRHGRGVAAFDGGRWQVLADLQNGTVQDAVVFRDDLWVTGDFRMLNGVATTGTVRHDGTGWQQMPTGGSVLAVHSDALYTGGLGSVRRFDGAAWQALPQIFGQVLAMVSYQGRLVVGGSHVSTSGSAVNLMEWDGVAWRTLGGGTDDAVNCLRVHNGELIVGGAFARAGGIASARVAAWNGSAWRSFGTGLDGLSVNGLGHLNGVLHVGGNLGRVGTGAQRNLARWDGTRFVAFTDFEGFPTDMWADDAAGELWIAGAHTAGGHPSIGLAVLSTRAPWSDLGGALAGSTGTPRLVARGQLTRGALMSLQVRDIVASAPGVHLIGGRRLDIPFAGGTLVPALDASVPFVADGRGWQTLALTVPAGLPMGQPLYVQSWVLDPPTQRLAATNGLSQSN